VKTYVISLPVSKERRAFQCTQLSLLGLDFSFVDAVSTDDLVNIEPSIALDRWERVLMPTEAACFFSHFRLWQMIASSDQPALVLEDDALLSNKVVAFFSSVRGLTGVDHITLETRLRKKLIGPCRSLGFNFGISRIYQDRTGAAAYILWPTGAKLLIERAHTNGAALADAFISNFYLLKSWQAVPALAIQSDIASKYGVKSPLNTHSYIQANDCKEHHQLPGLNAFRFKTRRIVAQLNLAIRFMSCVTQAKRIMVNIVAENFNHSMH